VRSLPMLDLEQISCRCCFIDIQSGRHFHTNSCLPKW